MGEAEVVRMFDLALEMEVVGDWHFASRGGYVLLDLSGDLEGEIQEVGWSFS